MSHKVTIVKLAAIGDVALGCRALTEFHRAFESDLELHWVVDEKLVPLARALTPGLRVHWHPISASALFAGNAVQKTIEALKLAKTIGLIQPNTLLLLHRDRRYQWLLRGVFTGSMLALDRKHAHELEIYRAAFARLAEKLGLAKKRVLAEVPPFKPRSPSGKIGILVGGGQNQRQTFREKRWPLLRELVELLLERTDQQIVLFGGASDAVAVQDLLRGLDARGRIENLVDALELSLLPAALAELDRFVSVDSGLAHIAANVMTGAHQKVVTLFGPTDPKLWAPKASGGASAAALYRGTECSPCYANDGDFKPCRFEGARFQHCMTEISPDQVAVALELKLGPKHS